MWSELITGMVISAGFFAAFVLVEAYKTYTAWRDDDGSGY